MKAYFLPIGVLLLQLVVNGAAREKKSSSEVAKAPFRVQEGTVQDVSTQRSGSKAFGRLLIKFANDVDERLGSKIQEIQALQGVAKAKHLSSVGMAVLHYTRDEDEEDLTEVLGNDPDIDLVVPDTWVHLDYLDSSLGQPKGARLPPVLDRVRSSFVRPKIALVGLWGKWLTDSSAAVLANAASLTTSETFELESNTDGSYSFKTARGFYVGLGTIGLVANSASIGDSEKFALEFSEDGFVQIRTSNGTFVGAQQDGWVYADRKKPGKWEKFKFVNVDQPQQRYSDDPLLQKLWGMHNYGGGDIRAVEAWQTFTGELSSGIVVGVIDTGIDYLHEDLSEQMWVNTGEIPDNGIDDDGNGFVDDVHGANFVSGDGDPMDDQLHGTHVSGTIAAIGNNGIGVAGVAWRGVRLMALKFLDSMGSGRTSDAIEAIDYGVANGARILSNSWGGGGANPALRMAIERAEQAGVLFVVAAGNSGSNNDKHPHYPSNYDFDNIISVAATGLDGDLSPFSCYGRKTVHVAAPGSDIYSTAPNGDYRALSGTSMACPHVTGLAALIWLYRPGLTMLEVKDIILTSALPVPDLANTTFSGGRIDAMTALTIATRYSVPQAPVNVPRGLEFADNDPEVGSVSGDIYVTGAADESDIDYYKVYFVSKSGFEIQCLGRVNATGQERLLIHINGSIGVPRFAEELVAVAGNATGEQNVKAGLPLPRLEFEDYGLPQVAPRAAIWTGDRNLRQGLVAGTLVVTRAADERTLSGYNIYWSNGVGQRGAFLGKLMANGFQSPECDSDDDTCGLINMTITKQGFFYERGQYGNQESAQIYADGPGVLRVTRFDTEGDFDFLQVGDQKLSGEASPGDLPVIVQLYDGPNEVVWKTDASITGSGWAFELIQANGKVEFDLPATAPLGKGLEVVAAFGRWEMAQGLYVALPDESSRAQVRVSSLVLDTKPNFTAKSAASKLRWQHGAGSDAESSEAKEPWIAAQMAAAAATASATSLWKAEASSEDLSPSPLIMASVFLLGLAPTKLGKRPEFREAVEEALVEALQVSSSVPVEVSLLQVSSVSSQAAAKGGALSSGARSLPERVSEVLGAEPVAASIDFQMRVPTSDPAALRLLLDKIEARVILLSHGGRSTLKFEEALFTALTHAGLSFSPVGLRVVFAQPQQVNLPPSRPQRRLAATPSEAVKQHLVGILPLSLCSAALVTSVLFVRRWRRVPAETALEGAALC